MPTAKPGGEGRFESWFLQTAFAEGVAGRILATSLQKEFNEVKRLHDLAFSSLGTDMDVVQSLETLQRAAEHYNQRIIFVLALYQSQTIQPTDKPTSKTKKVGSEYPGQRYGLTEAQSAMDLEQLYDGSKESRRAINALRNKNIATTMGDLAEATKGNPNTLLSNGKLKFGAISVQIVFDGFKRAGIELPNGKPKKGNEPAAKPKSGRATDETAEGKPWEEFGFTLEAWETQLKSLITEDTTPARKLKKQIGRRRMIVGDLYAGKIRGRMSRIKRAFFGKGFGPDTQKYLRDKLETLKVPQTMLVVVAAEPEQPPPPEQ